MSVNVIEKWWTPERLRAVELIAAGDKTDQQVADEVGITKRQLARWKNVPEFRERVNEIAAATAEKLRAEGVLRKQNRLINLQDRIDRMCRLIEARAREMADVPGGETGLLVRDLKGKYADREVYRFDAALVRELREHEKQAAQELGQWVEKQETSISGSGPLVTIVMPDNGRTVGISSPDGDGDGAETGD
ncbi:MAG TPA: hypothetical protein VNQ79_06720 [Blastocatellia bacterium]|nr:hypothetical protein [Blastocatellia bacterium]